MALPIASIPVLTGEVAQRFEAEAQANYEWYMNRSEEEKKADEAILEKKFAELYSMLSKAHLGRRRGQGDRYLTLPTHRQCLGWKPIL